MYCIYKITNLINGKTYIGQHKYKTLNDYYIGSGILLWKAYKKYGTKNFKKEIICKNVQYKETIDDMEKFYIKKEREQNPNGCYNIADGGQGGAFFKGKKHSEETKKKMSEGRKGEKNGFYGKHHSEEMKKRLSEAHKGKCLSEEAKLKLKGNQNAKGTRSEEMRKKMSKIKKGKHWKLVDGKRVWY